MEADRDLSPLRQALHYEQEMGEVSPTRDFFILFVPTPSTTIVSVPLKFFSFLIMLKYSVTGINYRLNSNKWSSGWPIGYRPANNYEAGRKFTWTSNPVLSVIAY